MTVLAVLFVVLRFLARWKKALKPGIDDWMIVAALLPFFTLVGVMLACKVDLPGVCARTLIVDSG